MSMNKAIKGPNEEIYSNQGFVHMRLVIAIVLVFGLGVALLLSNRISERAKKEQEYLVAESEKEATSSGEDKAEEELPKSKLLVAPEMAPTPTADPEPAQDKIEFDVHKDTSPAAMIGVDRYSCSVGEELAFDGSSSFGFHGALASYEWDFGDGSKGGGVKVSHNYSESGDYEIALTVQDGTNGKTDTTTTFVTINPPKLTVDDGKMGTATITKFYSSTGLETNESSHRNEVIRDLPHPDPEIKLGTTITVTAEAYSEDGSEVFYQFATSSNNHVQDWSKSNSFTFTINHGDVGVYFSIVLTVKDTHQYRRYAQAYDDSTALYYDVVP